MFGIILLVFSEILTGSSNIRKLPLGKQSFVVFPVKKMTEFGLRFSEVLMSIAQLLGRISVLGTMMFHENKIDAFNMQIILVLTAFYSSRDPGNSWKLVI